MIHFLLMFFSLTALSMTQKEHRLQGKIVMLSIVALPAETKLGQESKSDVPELHCVFTLNQLLSRGEIQEAGKFSRNSSEFIRDENLDIKKAGKAEYLRRNQERLNGEVKYSYVIRSGPYSLLLREIPDFGFVGEYLYCVQGKCLYERDKSGELDPKAGSAVFELSPLLQDIRDGKIKL